MSPDEIQEILEQYHKALREGIPITADFAKQVKDAQIGVRGFTQAQENLYKSLGKSVADYTKSMYEGQQGNKAFNASINSLTSAMEGLLMVAAPAALVVKGMRALAVGLTAVLGVVKFFKAAGEQSDKLFETFQDLSRVGSATSQGMSDVFGQMQKFGLGIEELDKMTALIKENSKELGMFSTTVATGVTQLSDVAAGIQRSGLQSQLLRMGMTVDGINRATAGYIVQQGNLGRLQGRTQAELTAGAAAYAKEMELLTRLTGQQREEMEAQRRQANLIDQFYATIQTMGPAGEKLYQVYNQLSAINPAAARGFAESVSGFLTGSKEQGELFMATGGALMENMELLKNESITVEQFLDRLGMAINDNREQLIAFGQIGSQGFGSLYSNLMLANKSMLGFANARESAEQNLEALDPLTRAQVEMRQQQRQARDSLQEFVKFGVKPATDALSGLARLFNFGARLLPGSPGNGAAQGGGTSSFGASLDRLAGGGNVEKIMATIRQRESSNNYQAQNPVTTASGAYQFIDKTWQSLTKQFGIGTEYKSAGLAPKEIQDAIAKRYVEDILRRAGGDVSKVPLEWYTGNLQGTMTAEGLRANRGLTSEMYQQRWMADFAKISGPTGGYRPSMTFGSPASAVASETSTALVTEPPTESSLISKFSGMLERLDTLVRINQNQLNVQQKQLAQTN